MRFEIVPKTRTNFTIFFKNLIMIEKDFRIIFVLSLVYVLGTLTFIFDISFVSKAVEELP